MIGRLNSEKTKNNILFLSGNNMFRRVENLNGFLTVTKQIVPEEVISPILGTYYTSADYGKNSSLIVKDTSHYLFEGISKTEIGGNYVASMETDKINVNTGSNVTVLAKGKNSLYDSDLAAERTLRAIKEKKVKTTSGTDIDVGCDIICVHSDTPNAVEIITKLKNAIIRLGSSLVHPG